MRVRVWRGVFAVFAISAVSVAFAQVKPAVATNAASSTSASTSPKDEARHAKSSARPVPDYGDSARPTRVPLVPIHDSASGGCNAGDLICHTPKGGTFCWSDGPCPEVVDGVATFSAPRIGGLRVDASTWDYDRHHPQAYEERAALAFCRYYGFGEVEHFRVESLTDGGGTYRFHDLHSAEFCPGCAWSFAEIGCRL